MLTDLPAEWPLDTEGLRMSIEDFSLDYFSLHGKRAVVTGGNTGLGEAFTLALAKAGADVLVPSVMDDGSHTKTLVEAQGRRMEFMQADLTVPGTPRAIIDRCVETLGSIDILVNCAGTCTAAGVLEFGRVEWDRMLNVNLTAAFEMSHEAAKKMVPQRSGKIINICSLFSFLGGQSSPAYAASKHGLAGLTKAYCDELGQYGIQVNGIAPGYFATDMTVATREAPEANRRVLDHVSAGRWGERSDLMGATVFLASKASNYVNGALLVVDGGYLVR